MRANYKSTKYVALFGDEIVQEFKTLTAAMIWLNRLHRAGFGADIRKVDIKGFVVGETIAS